MSHLCFFLSYSILASYTLFLFFNTLTASLSNSLFIFWQWFLSSSLIYSHLHSLSSYCKHFSLSSKWWEGWAVQRCGKRWRRKNACSGHSVPLLQLHALCKSKRNNPEKIKSSHMISWRIFPAVNLFSFSVSLSFTFHYLAPHLNQYSLFLLIKLSRVSYVSPCFCCFFSILLLYYLKSISHTWFPYL